MYVLRVSQYSMVMPLCADDPDRMGELQVWRLRTVKSSTEDMAVHQMLPSTDRDYHLQQIGVRKFDNALSRLPFFLFIQAVMDLMHVELLGNITVHLGKMLWMMFRQLRWSEHNCSNLHPHTLHTHSLATASQFLRLRRTTLG